MGCDIHLHTEIKINNRWHHYSVCNVERFYALFAKMADVSNYDEITPIAKPKGLPDDITEITQFSYDRMREDAHSDSWLSVSEIAELYRWLYQAKKVRRFDASDNFGYLFRSPWGSFEIYREDYPKEIEDFRFVFWFSN